MDRFDVIQFADLSGPQGGEWVRIGGGSFGVVFKGEYLGTPVAIKEVLPNNTYDVEKYFERECVLMKEARHPNIVQYIGLTKSPGPNGRIYIISEFVGGNVRSYIADTRKPFPWRLRISFAMDIARAVAYLHARNCMHRDLKGENLLITDNERIKVCDFGFARIAARNEEEMRRISYCGTDGYMSPEILLGVDFSLPSDVFSLGVIFCEIASRHLVDSNVFKRQMPEFGLDESEVREMASEGCPSRLIDLALDCVEVDPAKRPDMREIVRRLRDIEREIVEREERVNKGSVKPVGSIRGGSLHAVLGSKGGKSKKSTRPKAPRLPSFSGNVSVPLGSHLEEATPEASDVDESMTSSDDEELDAALAQLEKVHVGDALGTVRDAEQFKMSGHGNPWWSDDRSSLPSIRSSWLPSESSVRTPTSSRPALPSVLRDVNGNGNSSTRSVRQAGPSEPGADRGKIVPDVQYSTSVVKPSRIAGNGLGSAFRDSLSRMSGAGPSSVLMDLDDAEPTKSNMTVTMARTNDPGQGSVLPPQPRQQSTHNHAHDQAGPASYMTAQSAFADCSHQHDPSLAVATMASSIYSPAPLYHRFTLVKNGTRRPEFSKIKTAAGCDVRQQESVPEPPRSPSTPLLPPALMLATALTKCQVCSRRIGWKPFLDCDDCPYKCHVACGDLAEPSCQELTIPGSPHMQISPAAMSGRGSGLSPVVTTFNAEIGSPKLGNVSFDSTASSTPERDTKEKKGGAAARLKRWSSKSPPSIKT